MKSSKQSMAPEVFASLVCDTALVPFSLSSLQERWNDMMRSMIAAKGNQWGIVALCNGELEAYGMRGEDLTPEELTDCVARAVAFLNGHGFAPCKRGPDGKPALDKAGHRQPLTAAALSALRGDCRLSVSKQGAKAKAKAKAKTVETQEEKISDVVARDAVNNTPLNKAPQGDGKAALAAMGSGTATDKRYAHMLELAILTKDSKDANAKELSQMVRDMLGALM